MTVEDKVESRNTTTSLKLGEELPVFCEKCGYSLHGLAQMRCQHCTVLQFHCPECGHHQPINTLRPAAQKILGRIRGGWLVLVILFKLNLFGWLLFAWVGMGADWSYQYDYQATQAARTAGQAQIRMVWKGATFDWQSALAFGLFGWTVGMVWRMALLRWRRGWIVGIVLATLVMGCIMLGVLIQSIDLRQAADINPYNQDFVELMGLAFVAIVIGAATVWPIWSMLVQVFLPKGTAKVLLNWQRSLSSNEVSGLARE